MAALIVFDSPKLTEICRWLPGKSGPEGMWLPAWRHMLDTGMVMQRLLAQWVSTAEAQQMQGALSAEEWEQVAVLAALLHDVGKLTPLFASGLLPLLPDEELRLASYGLTVPKTMEGKLPHGFLGALWLRQQDCPHSLAAVVAAHHGKPADQETSQYLKKGSACPNPSHLYGQNGRDGQMAKLWEAAREAWLIYALQCCGFGSLSDVPEISKASQMLLSGLLIMADWIASNATLFPLLAPDEEPIAQVLAKRAEDAMEALHLPGPLYCDRPIADLEEFQERFSLPALPYPMQQAALQIAQDTISPGLMIVEAQMGTGKTEAAPAAAEQFLQKTGAGGVFFGLPTQATANGIFPRLLPEEILLPDSIPKLVQETYAEPTEEAKKNPAWKKHEKRLSDQKMNAKTFVLNACKESKRPELNTLNGLLDADVRDTERNGNAAVRDGAPGIEVLMLVMHPNGEIGLMPWHDGGRCFSAARTPDDDDALRIARQRIRLPHALCLDERGTISALEKQTAHFVPEWQHAPLLKGELFLLMDESLQARLGPWRLAYHPQDGLQYWKEDDSGAEQSRIQSAG